jgi:arabinose-5-phosphate isomerase
MLSGSSLPVARQGTLMTAAVQKMDRGGLGALLIVKEDRILAGIITDGDIRRAIARGNNHLMSMPVDDLMTTRPRTMGPDMPTYDALNMMEKHQITVLPITDAENRVEGILHLHDILGKGEFKFRGD